jgi:hypothetical protein
VTDSAGTSIDESSDNDGDLSYTLDDAADSDSTIPGTFTATLKASAEGYEPASKTVKFDLVEETDDESENVEPLFNEESDSNIESNSTDLGSLFE